MISLKRYLDSTFAGLDEPRDSGGSGILRAVLAAYGAAMMAMGNCSLDACPGLGGRLKERMEALAGGLADGMSSQAVELTDRSVQDELREWGQHTARHYRQKASEVKGLLLTMARTAESVGARDERCAGQIGEVTARLRQIATLDDLTQIRASIEKSAGELRNSVEKMAADGRAAVEALRKEVSVYQAKLEEAEELASRDPLTGVRSRLGVENLIEGRIAAGTTFCAAMVDIDGFKRVNDSHGHTAGDELLKQFAAELRSVCRSTDVIGRWGGDEFIIVLDYPLADATAQIERLRKWVCGSYTVHGPGGEIKLRLDASIGLAEHLENEPMNALVARADGSMYECKGARKDRAGH